MTKKKSPKKTKPKTSAAETLAIRDCALITLATGIRAQNLKELADGLIQVEPSSIYHHFWGRLLQPSFDEPEYSNDFAAWAFHGLHDKILAERLSVVDPTEFDDIEDLRQEVLEIVESRLDEYEVVPWSKADAQFHFTRSQVVVLDTGIVVNKPEQLDQLMPDFSPGSIFYHFIDARRRTATRSDDFSDWLATFGTEYEYLCSQLLVIDPFFSYLKQIQNQLTDIFKSYFGGPR